MRSSFDKWMLAAVGAIAVFIAFLVLRGDHVGVQIIRATPEGRAGPGSVVTIQFSEAMKRETVADRLSFEPAISGAITWTGSRLIYRPAQPLPEGSQQRVVLKSGAEAEGGRALLQDLHFSFDVIKGRVAYLAPEDGSVRDIWLADQTGREPERLTQSAFGVLSFDVSRDGTKIAFAERKGAGASADLKLLDIETKEVRPLASCGEFVCTNPVWSPDGIRLAYERLSYNAVDPAFSLSSTRVWLLDTSASPPTGSPLLAGSQVPPNYRPRWSPDGQHVAVSRLPLLPDRNPGILVYNVADESTVFFPTGFGSMSAFSPDSSRLIYPGFAVRGAEMRTVLQMADLRTSEVAEIPGIETQAQEALASWMPDGSALVVARRGAEGESARGRQLYVMQPDTGESEPLVVDSNYDHAYFAWDQLGRSLILERALASGRSTAGDAPRSQVWTYDSAARAFSLVATNAFHPRWVP